MKTPLPPRRALLVALLALAVAPYFAGLDRSSLWDSNEAFYAETPREMNESGDYINPAFNYQPRFNKPPLSYWVVALSYKLLGVSEMSERLPIAISATVLIATAFLLARAAFSLEAGLFAALALAATPRFLMFSRRIIIDSYLAMFMGLALLLFTLARKDERRRRVYLALMYASVGFGILTKGPVAALLPAVAFVAYLAAFERLGKIREMMLPAGILIVAAIVLPWYAAIYSQHGWQHIESFILRDNLSRYTEPIWGPRRGALFYLPVIVGDMFPWSVFMICGLWLIARGRRVATQPFAGPAFNGLRRSGPALGAISRSSLEEAHQAGSKGNLRALLAIWVAVIVLFFSLSRNKEDLYILPVYAAAAAIAGGVLSQLTAEARGQRASGLSLLTAATGIVVAAAGAAILPLFAYGGEQYRLAGAASIGWITLFGGLTAAALALFKRRFSAVAAMALTIILMNWVFALVTLPDFERYKPVRPLCQIIASRAAPDAMIGYYRFSSPSMAFYLRRPIFEHFKQEEIEAAFSSDKAVYCLIMREDYEAIRESLPVATYILASRPVFQVKLKSILDRTGLPQVLLISNRGETSSS